eukprot:XP_001704577.1 Hypothetical protein GL50803_104196 [Giardia lamblia ATCC 50803]
MRLSRKTAGIMLCRVTPLPRNRRNKHLALQERGMHRLRTCSMPSSLTFKISSIDQWQPSSLSRLDNHKHPVFPNLLHVSSSSSNNNNNNNNNVTKLYAETLRNSVGISKK